MTYKYKIMLNSIEDIEHFIRLTNTIKSKVSLVDPYQKYCTNAKSFLDTLVTTEWDNLYCKCDEDISKIITQYIVDE